MKMRQRRSDSQQEKPEAEVLLGKRKRKSVTPSTTDNNKDKKGFDEEQDENSVNGSPSKKAKPDLDSGDESSEGESARKKVKVKKQEVKVQQHKNTVDPQGLVRYGGWVLRDRSGHVVRNENGMASYVASQKEGLTREAGEFFFIDHKKPFTMDTLLTNLSSLYNRGNSEHAVHFDPSTHVVCMQTKEVKKSL